MRAQVYWYIVNNLRVLKMSNQENVFLSFFKFIYVFLPVDMQWFIIFYFVSGELFHRVKISNRCLRRSRRRDAVSFAAVKLERNINNFRARN